MVAPIQIPKLRFIILDRRLLFVLYFRKCNLWSIKIDRESDNSLITRIPRLGPSILNTKLWQIPRLFGFAAVMSVAFVS